MLSAALMLGTSSWRVPSGFCTSIARPRLMWAGVTRLGLPSMVVEADVHRRHRLERLDQRVADQVGERHLAAAGAGEVVVDDDAVVPEQLDRDRAHGGGGRHGQRGVHVLRGPGRGAAQHRVGRLVPRRRRRGGLGLLGDRAGGALGRLGGLGRRGAAWRPGPACWPWPRRALRRPGLVSAGLARWPWSRRARSRGLRPLAAASGQAWGRLRRGRGRVRPVARPLASCLEVRDPDRVHAPGIALVLVEHLLDEPLVGAEVGGGLARDWSDWLPEAAARLGSPLPRMRANETRSGRQASPRHAANADPQGLPVQAPLV